MRSYCSCEERRRKKNSDSASLAILATGEIRTTRLTRYFGNRGGKDRPTFERIEILLK